MIKTETFSFWEQIFWKENWDTKKYEKSGDRSFWISLTILTTFFSGTQLLFTLNDLFGSFSQFSARTVSSRQH